MDSKQARRAFTKMVDKFTSTSVQFDAGLATEAQLKKCACDQLAVCLRLQEVETLAVEHLIEGWTTIIKADRDALEEPTNKVCGDLYQMINKLED